MKTHAPIINDRGPADAGDDVADRWRARDLAVLWHPCTQMREHPDTLPLLPVARGEGAWLIGHDGRRTLDAISSWWTNIHGHSEPRIAESIAQRATQPDPLLNRADLAAVLSGTRISIFVRRLT